MKNIVLLGGTGYIGSILSKLLDKKFHVKSIGRDTNESFIIGDTWRDIELGNRSNITTILVDRKYPKNLTKIKKTKPEFIIQSFKELGKIIK